jgi:hypothetical protein
VQQRDTTSQVVMPVVESSVWVLHDD